MRARAKVWGACLALAMCAASCNPNDSSQRRYKVPIGESPVLGPSDAWVTLVEFADFECPFCARAKATVHQIVDTWPADARVAFKNFPIPYHTRAMPAALAAECAREQNRFWEMYDAIYGDPDHLEDADLEAKATSIGLDLDSWRACLTSDAATAYIDADEALGSELDIPATPSFFINGRLLLGAQPFETFRAAIESALSAAQSSGVDRSQYYDKVVLGE